MSLLVFGRSGQVATELRRQAEVTALGREDADLTDPDACAATILAARPSAVINAAAYTAVDRAEEEEALATVINGEAPGAMARTCAKLAIPFLHVSTDYVFDGSGDAPWHPEDTPAPINAYGRSKLAGETAIRDAGGHWAVLRTSWVFSPHGANFVKTMLRLSETRDALSVVEDQIGGPTPASGIAAALLSMVGTMQAGQGGGLYHYAGAPATSWKCFARETFERAGRQVSVTGIPTVDYPTPAQRPLNSRLDCSCLEADFGISPPDWRDALSQTLKELTS
ncbi:dTDP-4-dehydrorhamnose reductase [Salipiger bermudensis]|uniref:dTDP-4-dehydrorhamnose reductase n=1 Tax=Salipiger bermudensis TaxID=344736 RepID=UPI001C99889B|nr:dTDP-4-dehydrorhamnose reductase [Salipiger bermudensis]MBY6006620.1 dTDP-4-dehydrorhamnose reductase [Salipiger bermudensis]